MVQPVNGIDLATDIVVIGRVEEVLDRGVFWITSEDLLGLLLSTELSVTLWNLSSDAYLSG